MRNRRVGKAPWSKPLGELVRSAIDPVLARRGFGLTGIVLHWDEIVGERLAAMSRPVKVQWPARRGSPGTENGPARAALVVRVETAGALELQHLAPVVIERVNAYFGWQCIARLVLMQGPVAALPAARHAEVRVVDKAAEAAAADIAGEIRDEALRQALVRLGARVLAGP
jgi:hypothetical protein